MQDLSNIIELNIRESIAIKEHTIELAPTIKQAINAMATCLKNDRKILSCGNGGSAADSQHFAAELINRFEIERPALPAISLTTDTSNLTSIANDYSFDNIFSRQVEALGAENDCLLLISTSGNSPNILNALKMAHIRKMRVIALTGKDGGELAKHLSSNDIEIRISSKKTSRVQEAHIMIIHIFCDGIDKSLFSNDV